LGQPSEVKNGPIILKFGTIVDWMNTLGVLILIFDTPPKIKFILTEVEPSVISRILFCKCVNIVNV